MIVLSAFYIIVTIHIMIAIYKYK